MSLRAIRPKTSALLAALVWLAAAAPASAAEGVSPGPDVLFSLGPLPVTNSMVTTWFFSLTLILLVRWAVGKPQLIPSRGQTLVETVVNGLRDIFELIVGKDMIGRVFPLLIGFFVFILIMNWSGLLPGAGAIGVVHDDGAGHLVLENVFRPADSDLNTTLALAIVSFVSWLYFVLRYAGPGTLMKDLFGNKADKKEVHILIYLALSFIFFLVGIIEVISILSRLISLSVRLYGNIYGGESLLDAMYAICPYGLPVPFYILELLVGVVQAFVFTVLTAVYIGLICNHESGDHDEEDHGAEPHAEAKPAH
jgi:F-type H+-transporting ATPase subunit a